MTSTYALTSGKEKALIHVQHPMHASSLSTLPVMEVQKIDRKVSPVNVDVIHPPISFSRQSVCLDSCRTAKNGVCDDGRGTEIKRSVTCDLGTDCSDCGPWNSTGPVSWAEGKVTNKGMKFGTGPIALLESKNVTVRVKKSVYPPEIEFAYTDPLKDFDVSAYMENNGVVEKPMTWIFYQIFKKGCIRPDGSRSLFVDVGANFGWYSLIAAKMGCKVIAFEPVPHFGAFFEYSMHLNGLSDRIIILKNVVSNVSGSTVEMVVPSHGIWGTAGIGGHNIDKSISGATFDTIRVNSIRLEDLITQDVLLMKVDVEGWEWSVMKGAAGLLSNFNVENIIMEYSPGVPERSFHFKEMRYTVEMILDILKAGYRIGQISDGNKHLKLDFEASLPALEEVTSGIMAYDLEDVKLFEKDQLGCPIPKSLMTKFPKGWSICRATPEDINPYSFRSVIQHNTNIWASKPSASSLLKLNGTVGMMTLGVDDIKEWFVDRNHEIETQLRSVDVKIGLGSRICKDMSPDVQVRHRCKCSVKEKCGEEERLVLAVSKAGLMKQNYVIEA